jgi:hypothetical protein
MMEIKNGLKTSEFWLAVAPYVGQLIVVILFALGQIDQETFLWLMGSGFLGGSYASSKYSEARAEIKSSQAWRSINSLEAAHTHESVG